MITTLRKKFISITATALFALIAIVLIAVNSFFIYQNSRSINKNLDILLNSHVGDYYEGGNSGFGEGKPKARSREDFPVDFRNNRDFFILGGFENMLDMKFDGAVIFLDADGDTLKIKRTTDDFYDDDELSALGISIFEKGSRKGRSGYYKYEMIDTDQGEAAYEIAVINASNEIYSVLTMLVISIATALVSFAIVLIVIIRASNRAIKPFAESYEKQKRFITDAGHELKTPITVISANNDVARLTYGDSEIFDTIERQVLRLKSLVKNLITLSKMDEEQKPEFSRFNMSEAALDTVDSFRLVAENKNKELVSEIKDGIFINGDETKIRQMMVILMDNAIKYCDDGGRIKAELYDAQGKIHFAVTNDYKEVKNLDLSSLFERFYRHDESRLYDGSYGLGLPIAKAVMSIHGGSISARSKGDDKICFDAVFKR